MKLDLKDLDPMSKNMLYGYIIIPLSSINYDVHTKAFFLCAVYSIPNSIFHFFFGYVAALKIYPLPVTKGIYLRRLTTESNFISNDHRMFKKLNVSS